MKKLFTILWILFTTCMAAFCTADEIFVNLNPDQQYAIMWSELQFDVSTSGSVTQDSTFTVILPSDLKFLHASIPPRNALQVQLGDQPYWLVESWAEFQVVVTAREISQEFDELVVVWKLTQWDSGLATWLVTPIADIQVEKTMTSQSPKIEWDLVSFDIVIKNIWSKLAENVKVVDVWPDNILTFSNYWTLNWTQIVPYIYNGVSNQYEFEIWDIEAGEEMILTVDGTLNSWINIGTQFVNTAFAIMWWDQYSTWNDTSNYTGSVSGYPNIYITGQKLSVDPSINWDSMNFSITYGNNGQEMINTGKIVIYLPEIMNQNNISVSLEWWEYEWYMYSREIIDLAVGAQNTILISWEMMTSNPVWAEYMLNGRAYVIWQDELTWADNDVILTWVIRWFSSLDMSATIKNLTKPSFNVSDTQIQAISGDNSQISISITNNGNITQTWVLRVVYGNENRYFNDHIQLIPWKSAIFTVEKEIWPKNYQSMTPEIKFTYGDAQTISKTVTINEPLQCGDWFITQNEACDTASNEWLLQWQHCADDCMSIITDNIINTACIEYSSQRWNGELCDDAIIYIWDQNYACESLTSSSSTIPIDDDGNWSVTFSCSASNDQVASTIVIDCGNGTTWTWTNTNTFTHACNYRNTTYGYPFHATCTVNGETPTNPACEKDITAWYVVPDCGNGIIEAGEDCDLKWNYGQSVIIRNYLDYFQTIWAWKFANKWYSCKNCKIIDNGWNFVYEPAECLYTDTPISVMNNELVPYRWRLWIKDTQTVEDDYRCSAVASSDRSSTNSKTILKESSMKCHFAVYNGNHKQWDDPIMTFTEDCFNENFDEYDMYRYFDDYHKTSSDWASFNSVLSLTDGNTIDEFGEYKLVLEKVEYKYCNTNNGSREDGARFGAVCEVDFAVTRPYVMQISTLWASPVGTDATKFLDDYYDMKWNKLLTRTDLSSVIKTDGETYNVNTNMESKFKEFKNKYEKLAVNVDMNTRINGTTLRSIFGSNVTEIRKVPNQSIYFIKWDWDLVLEQEKIKTITSAFTIIVEWMDVVIKWNVSQYAMIVTEWQMSFVDGWSDSDRKYKNVSRCASGWQVVQWIYVALDWFKEIDSDDWLRNTDAEALRCPRWGLYVKWVLIWDDIENIMNSKRSQLNSWFNSAIMSDRAVNTKRRQLIIWWASVLIEYNPSLRKTLPPGAEIFTESLEVYRR